MKGGVFEVREDYVNNFNERKFDTMSFSFIKNEVSD
jgi:hypothetical protein